MKIRKTKKRVQQAITLHGKAWTAIDAFVNFMVPQNELDAMDNEYEASVFYPYKPMQLAIERLAALWKESNEKPPIQPTPEVKK